MLVSVLLHALSLGLVPDRHGAILEGRARLCEVIALNSSAFVRWDRIDHLEATLRAIVERDDTILSAAVRRQDGKLIAEVGNHAAHWVEATTSDSHVYVPIWAVTVLFALPPIFWFMWSMRRRRIRLRIRQGLCVRCGYDMRGSPGACPECGHGP